MNVEIPPFIPPGKTWSGMGTLQLATAPSMKSARDHEVELRSLIAYYKGKDWLPHLTIVGWYGNQQALIASYVWPQTGEAMCAWLHSLGWYHKNGAQGHGLPGKRMCRFHRDWFEAKP